ncbi:hypothetical protein [Chelatococcus asaccharovorans]|uniref:Uncharacterized protein n=1 Tax=Chelatococcus asaccharovorans TaxID=28210 RepID=A0A2V3TZ61_9HYPH|nr:hypothetical protein [Chelatococcus asaccharovorans]MBS7704632.1 hypothetical protein [Chelatococcus asaccharovorans]PXW54533.1 hypothetical protein C7450_11164 [Chelatococcus asaccharovorans]
MIGLLRQFAAGAIAPVQAAARRTLIDIVMLAGAGVLFLVALVFGAISATQWLSLRYGFVQATAIMTGVFLAAAIAVLLVRIVVNRRPSARGGATGGGGAGGGVGMDAAARGGLAGGALGQGQQRSGLTPEELALLGTQDIVKSLTPFQLTLVAGLAGFVGGRLLDKNFTSKSKSP